MSVQISRSGNFLSGGRSSPAIVAPGEASPRRGDASLGALLGGAPAGRSMEERHARAQRKAGARTEALADHLRRNQERAMESFGTITYHSSTGGELRSCIDTTPVARSRPASAKVPLPPWTEGSSACASSPLSAMPSTIDIIYSSASQTLNQPPPLLSLCEKSHGQQPPGYGALGGALVAVPLRPPARTTHETSVTAFTRRQAATTDSQQRQRSRPRTATSQRPTAVVSAGGITFSTSASSATLRRPKSAGDES